MTRNVTDNPERYRIYRLCECIACAGTGKVQDAWPAGTVPRCQDCRGEGRTRDLVATCASPEALGVALVHLGREHEFDECPVGILDSEGNTGEKWLVKPWQPSARNISDAGRTLQAARKGKA